SAATVHAAGESRTSAYRRAAMTFQTPRAPSARRAETGAVASCFPPATAPKRSLEMTPGRSPETDDPRRSQFPPQKRTTHDRHGRTWLQPGTHHEQRFGGAI